MNTKTQSFLVLALAALLMVTSASDVLAGANETPGANFRPHTFSSFSSNLWEFGNTDIGIFRKWVVGNQHYAQGATYGDTTNDLSSGGGGIWNFFTFCGDGNADVLLVTSHGWNNPTTSIEQYPPTPQGLAARDSVFNYYSGVFAPGTIMKRNWVRSNGTIRSYHLDVTQAFYSTYFQTPQAMAWWATCWSSLLNMTAATEARCFLGYNQVVQSSKCYCDERRILKRMDGQSGQANRPLAAASAGINGACPPGGASLILQGKLNTTLSPSVTGNAPTGIVCGITPGFVHFDTSMDVTVPPASVVVARSDAVLIDHVWVGNDHIEFLVVPLVEKPFILYDVIESKARSLADRARLDGNTRPPVNALGPNRDDYVWVTVCPFTFPEVPIIVIDPIPDPVTPTIPGTLTTIVTAVANTLTEPIEAIITLVDSLLWTPLEPKIIELIPDEINIIEWTIQVPPGLPAGFENPLTMTIEGPGDPIIVEGLIVVDPVVDVQMVSSPLFLPGMPQLMQLRVENQTDGFLDFENVIYESDIGAGWQVQPLNPELTLIEPGGVFFDEIIVQPPPEALPGEGAPLDFFAEINGLPTQIPVGDIFIGLPLIVDALDPLGFAVGNPNAELPFLLTNPTDVDLAIDLFANDSFGFPLIINCPPMLLAGETAECQIFVDLPPDQLLIGESGLVNVQIVEEFGFQMIFPLSYIIEPAINIIQLPYEPIYVGDIDEHLFDLPFLLENNSALPLLLSVEPISPGLPIMPPFTEVLIPPSSGLELMLQALVLDGQSPGIAPAELHVLSSEDGPRGIGDTVYEFEIEVFNPVVVDLHARGIAGNPGEIVTVGGTIRNLRTDTDMSGGYEWSDEKGWLLGDLIGSYSLAAGESDSLTMDVQLPLNFSAAADSDSVALTVDMTYDTGLPTESFGSTWVMVLGDSVTAAPDGDTPAFDRLAGIFPNPFNPQTRVRFHLVETGRIELSVLDVNGRRVRSLASETWDAGVHELSWDGRNDEGRPIASGVYFVQLRIREHTFSSKAILLK